MNLAQIFYLYFLALALAFLEVQVEGPDGWAARLPCWRPHSGKWYARVYTKVLGGKEMTGYHAGVFSFAFLMFHLPYVFGMPWSGGAELATLSQFFLFVVVWDFLWFVINPHYGIKKFRAGCVAWHRVWLAGVPVDYWGGVGLSFLFHAMGVRAGAGATYGTWLAAAGWFAVLLSVAVLAVEILRRYGILGKR